MFRLTLSVALLATGGVAVAQELAPIPAAPYSPGPAQTLSAPPIESAPVYPHAADDSYVGPQPAYGGASYGGVQYGGPPVYGAGHPGPAYPGPVGPTARVKYEDLDNIAPCAVPQVVCFNGKCGVQYVEICAPPGYADIKRGKRKTKYDYGDYKVELKEKDGYILVDYDD